jgi:hypothetical protein
MEEQRFLRSKIQNDQVLRSSIYYYLPCWLLRTRIVALGISQGGCFREFCKFETQLPLLKCFLVMYFNTRVSHVNHDNNTAEGGGPMPKICASRKAQYLTHNHS